ncbi:MAG: nucleotidyltransferase domain-containing protein [Candidatus Aminicenantes bacterium]|nr:nucleotidyltransferase domain-containing protein [Candidatus Aminicenantes bacterium]
MVHLIEDKIAAINKLCRKHKVRQLYLFGSACTPKFNEESDIDFLISFDGVPLLDYADNFFDLQEALQGLLNRKVDLLVEKSIQNPYLKNTVEKTKELVYYSQTLTEIGTRSYSAS